jgi:hypothetical protein
MITREQLAEDWLTMTVKEIAAKHSVGIQAVYAAARRFGFEYKMILNDDDDSEPGKDDPTPEQIAERAKEIRDAWTDEEHERRFIGKRRVRFEFPRISSADMFGETEPVSYSRV